MSGQPRRWQRILLAMVVVAIPMGASSVRAELADDLVAYWPLDSTFNDAHGVLHGEERGAEPIAFQAAMFGEGIRLNGADQYVEITGGSEAALDFVGGDVSISAWFTVDNFDTSWQALIAKGENNGWRIHRRSGEPTMTYAGGAPEPATGGPDVTDGEFHHIVAISENGVSTRYWMDGELASTGPAPDIQLPNTNNRVRIGDNPSTNGREWEGFIDDVAIWSRALTAGEIGAIWSNGTGNNIGALLNPGDPGDFNRDGTVDTADFAIMVSNFGEPGKFGEGDFDFNGRINMNDFLAFRTVFNAQPAGAANVPEPSGLVLLTVGGLLFIVRRRIV